MYKRAKTFSEFTRRVEMLWAPDYEDRELEELPSDVFGGFDPCRLDDFLKLMRLHPEYHVAVCIEPELYINTFIEGAQTYHLAEGDADPSFVYDPHGKLDALFIQSLNSGRSRRSA